MWIAGESTVVRDDGDGDEEGEEGSEFADDEGLGDGGLVRARLTGL